MPVIPERDKKKVPLLLRLLVSFVLLVLCSVIGVAAAPLTAPFWNVLASLPVVGGFLSGAEIGPGFLAAFTGLLVHRAFARLYKALRRL